MSEPSTFCRNCGKKISKSADAYWFERVIAQKNGENKNEETLIRAVDSTDPSWIPTIGVFGVCHYCLTQTEVSRSQAVAKTVESMRSDLLEALSLRDSHKAAREEAEAERINLERAHAIEIRDLRESLLAKDDHIRRLIKAGDDTIAEAEGLIRAERAAREEDEAQGRAREASLRIDLERTSVLAESALNRVKELQLQLEHDNASYVVNLGSVQAELREQLEAERKALDFERDRAAHDLDNLHGQYQARLEELRATVQGLKTENTNLSRQLASAATIGVEASKRVEEMSDRIQALEAEKIDLAERLRDARAGKK